MTRQKNEIANGVRLENASWRTWWKQRNKLKTVSPETLNWWVSLPPAEQELICLPTGSRILMSPGSMGPCIPLSNGHPLPNRSLCLTLSNRTTPRLPKTVSTSPQPVAPPPTSPSSSTAA
ncbi:hypothetical protein CPB84DRAFT_1678865 [Gymnopilus junonius]|uniref:Nitrogen regulatory protein areA GATA-like domain-containing protein n=1 Tax=Gymnopilus junonius TaxID=109634 RepID=A0A9P5TN74_GYMJU|nr:hypothetical protein CPB84DRAFT_1678865 [Gymnopilus junonius]